MKHNTRQFNLEASKYLTCNELNKAITIYQLSNYKLIDINVERTYKNGKEEAESVTYIFIEEV